MSSYLKKKKRNHVKNIVFCLNFLNLNLLKIKFFSYLKYFVKIFKFWFQVEFCFRLNIYFL